MIDTWTIELQGWYQHHFWGEYLGDIYLTVDSACSQETHNLIKQELERLTKVDWKDQKEIRPGDFAVRLSDGSSLSDKPKEDELGPVVAILETLRPEDEPPCKRCGERHDIDSLAHSTDWSGPFFVRIAVPMEGQLELAL